MSDGWSVGLAWFALILGLGNTAWMFYVEAQRLRAKRRAQQRALAMRERLRVDVAAASSTTNDAAEDE